MLEYDVPKEGDILVSPGEDVSIPENEKLDGFFQSVLIPRLKNPSATNKILKIHIATLLNGLNNYARLVANKNKFSWKFEEELDGARIYRTDEEELARWQQANLTRIAKASMSALTTFNQEQCNGQLKLKTHQYLVIQKLNTQDYYTEDYPSFFESKAEILQTIEILPYHALWKDQEDRLIENLAHLVVYYNEGQKFLSKIATARVTQSFNGTGLTTEQLMGWRSVLNLQTQNGFTEREFSFWLQALGLDENKFEAARDKHMKAFDETQHLEKAKLVYAKITQAVMQDFWLFMHHRRGQMEKSGITQEQVHLTFMSGLMVSTTKASTWPLFKTNILEKKPARMILIQEELSDVVQAMGDPRPCFPVRDNRKSLASIVDKQPVPITQPSPPPTSRPLLFMSRKQIEEVCVSFFREKIDQGTFTRNSLRTVELALKAWEALEEQEQQLAQQKRLHQ